MTEIKDKLVTLEDLKTVTDNMSDILGINDMTTGINLLRGTRDFAIGKILTDSTTTLYKDGFQNSGSFTFSKDDEGFVVATKTLTSATSSELRASAIYGIKPKEKITVCFEVSFENNIPTGNIFNIVTRQGASSSSTVVNYKAGQMIIDPQVGVWNIAKIEYEVPSTLIGDDIFVTPRVVFGEVGTIHFRKLCAYKGSISNPIWSASPFDVAQDALAGDSPIYNLGLVDDAHNIPEGADLNAYTTAGTYASKASANAPTLQNSPVSSNAFKLYVDNPTGGSASYVMQRLVIGHENAVEYLRYSADKGSSWTDWRQTYGNTTVRPVAGGGTGDSTAKGARNNLFGSDVTADEDVRNDDIRFLQHKSNLADRVTYRTGLQVWNWIASKIRSVFGFTEDNKLPADRIDGNNDESYVDINISSSGISSQDNFNGINLVIKKGNSEWEELVKKDRIELTLEFSSGSILSTSTDIHYRCSIHLEYSLGDDTIRLYPEVTSGTATQGWTVFPVPTNSCTMTMGPLTKDQFNAGYTFPLRFSKYMPYKQSSSSSAGIATISLGDSVRIYQTE